MSQSRTISSSKGLRGEIRVPGDKSISHRSIMFGSLAEGKTRVSGFLQGEDNYATLKAFQSMGVEIIDSGDGRLEISGVGLHGLHEPSDLIDCGNSGTTMRLMTGLLSGQDFFSVLTGDQYLRCRPMRRVVTPLTMMGAGIDFSGPIVCGDLLNCHRATQCRGGRWPAMGCPGSGFRRLPGKRPVIMQRLVCAIWAVDVPAVEAQPCTWP